MNFPLTSIKPRGASLRQGGMAIVLAMGTAAAAAMVATAILASQGLWARQSEVASNHAQARMLLAAGADWARSVLYDDSRMGNVDHLGEPWALRLPPVAVENGELSGRIQDQDGAFNLNNLLENGAISIAQLARLRRLLEILDLSPTLADAIADWIDADGEVVSNAGAEDAYYLALARPYLPGNRPLVDVSELARVRGFDENALARLRPFVSALPRTTALNVNTASPEVLAAAIDGLGLDGARSLAAERDRRYFRDREDFTGRLPRGLSVDARNISVASDYFLVNIRVAFGDAEARGTVMLARGVAGWPEVLWRKLR